MANGPTKSVAEAKSWAKSSGQPGNRPLVAQVFFKTDDDTMDPSDTKAMAKRIFEYGLVLLGRRIELSFVGHADHRGSESYNMTLAKRRAESVKKFFDRHLGGYRFYSSWDAVS